MSTPSVIEDRNKVAVVGSQLLGVFLVIITLLTQHGELRSRRPTGTKNQIAAQEDQNKDRFARLWDDPLEDFPTFQVAATSPSPAPRSSTSPRPLTTSKPAYGELAEHSPSPTSSPSPAALAQASPKAETTSPTQTQAKPGRLPPGASVKYMFLWNIVDARPLPEITERRLRIRYALVSAILTDGYLPLRESVLRPLFEPGDESLPVKDRRPIGRFETFRKPPLNDKQPWQYVSVIWIPKQLESMQLPIKSAMEIETTIQKQDIEDVSNKSVKSNDWFLHHGNSDDLAKFTPASTSSPENIAFVRATVPLKRLPIQPPRGWKSLQKITTDKVLVKALVGELSRRIPALHNQKKAARVVVFTESDTTYSQAITKELRNRLEKKRVKLEIYSYLRALDGKPDEPRLPEGDQNSNSQESAASLLQQKAISETSFGTSQFDYLRRTALDLKAGNRSRGNVVAVGVLGSDIYDKMLVLQAVRPVLPAAVFFTTDLDALYLERSMEPFTRNLVVASADGLEVKKNPDALTTRSKLPSMRDSYQTVLVKEVRNILRQGKHTQTGSVRIFEIGAGNAVDLRRATATSCPLRWLAKPLFIVLIFLAALANAFLILCAVLTRDKKNSPRGAMEKWAKWCVYSQMTLAGMGVLVLFFILTLWNPIFRRLDFLFGEPLNLGVSIWPSVMIRLLAFGVAIYLLSRAYYSFVIDGGDRIQALKKALRGRIQLRAHPNKNDKVVSKSFPTFRRLFNRARKALARTMQFRWAVFHPRTLRRRIEETSFAYLLLSFLLFFIWQPTVPGRGGLALLIEKVALALGVALYIVHLMFCLDLHFSALQLLRTIESHFDPGSPRGSRSSIDLERMLTSLGTLTTIIGKTLLYPLTVLILIILSRLTIFDNWVMTPSLMITFLAGAIVLVAASLILWLEGTRLRNVILDQDSLWPVERDSVRAINNGVFAAWYKQPIFSAILSVLAIFGSLSIAGPLIRLFSESY